MAIDTKQSQKLPDGPLVSWYGDDFTGAAAVMEVLTFAGLPSILFLDVPDQAQLAQFSDLRGIGIASTARAQSPLWMDQHLPQAFDALAQLGAPVVHYKVCTTLDSSPDSGSIGRAIEIGARVFDSRQIPVLVAAPQMRRFQFFGHLFASMDNGVYRIDRHPVMAQHPVTPIHESDVAQHLSLQAPDVSFATVNLETMNQPQFSLAQVATQEPVQASVLDCIDAASEAAAGRLLWNHKDRFVVGSQGIEYALVRHWQNEGYISVQPAPLGIGRAAQMAVVSGSVSKTTAAQIAWSAENGFECIAFDIKSLIKSEEAVNRAIDSAVSSALNALASGQDPLVYTAKGPDDPAVATFKQALDASGQDGARVNQRLGAALGQVLYRIVDEANLGRAVISGGDTSGFATQQLGIYALSALAPTIPGAAIFKAHATGGIDGLQLALKGGQMGTIDYFGWVKDGGGPES